jgi:hypothetical protein
VPRPNPRSRYSRNRVSGKAGAIQLPAFDTWMVAAFVPWVHGPVSKGGLRPTRCTSALPGQKPKAPLVRCQVQLAHSFLTPHIRSAA